jgi:hypothetical protein
LLTSTIAGDGEDAGVVVAESQSVGERLDVGVVELHAHGAARVTHRHRLIQASMLDAQIVEQAQGLAREVSEFRMTALALEFGDDDNRDHHVVLVEPEQCPRVREEDGGVQDVGGAGAAGDGHVASWEGSVSSHARSHP